MLFVPKSNRNASFIMLYHVGIIQFNSLYLAQINQVTCANRKFYFEKSVRFKIYITRQFISDLFFFDLIFITYLIPISHMKKIRCDIYRRITRDSKNFIISSFKRVFALRSFFFFLFFSLSFSSTQNKITIGQNFNTDILPQLNSISIHK